MWRFGFGCGYIPGLKIFPTVSYYIFGLVKNLIITYTFSYPLNPSMTFISKLFAYH